MAEGLPRNKRLSGKVPAGNTDYSNTKLVTKAEEKRLKGLKVEQLKKKAKVERAAKARAVRAIISQPELAHGEDHAMGVATLEANRPHGTHDVKQFAASDTMILFCDTCGRWQRHNAGRSKLSNPCEPIREGNKSGRKLLRHSIIPSTGARLHASVITPGGKRC